MYRSVKGRKRSPGNKKEILILRDSVNYGVKDIKHLKSSEYLGVVHRDNNDY